MEVEVEADEVDVALDNDVVEELLILEDVVELEAGLEDEVVMAETEEVNDEEDEEDEEEL